MTPSHICVHETIYCTTLETPLGPMVAAATGQGLCLLEFAPEAGEPLARLRRFFSGPMVESLHPHLETVREELARYFSGRLREFTVPLVYPGTPFQCLVWSELLRIPYGQTRSYQEIAAAVGRPGAVRAVGLANGQNRIAIIIPCHRVIQKNGQLGGYGGGPERKRYLLALEQGTLHAAGGQGSTLQGGPAQQALFK